MTNPPLTFSDPLTFPVRFVQRMPPKIYAFGESTFPVSFSVDDSPRKATILGGAAFQLGTVLVDKDVHDEDSGVSQLGSGEAQVFELQARGHDISSAVFQLRMPSTGSGSKLLRPYAVGEARQPSFEGTVSHAFRHAASTRAFDPVNYGGGFLYPAGTMTVTVMPMLSVAAAQTSLTAALYGDTLVAIAASGAYGVVDVRVDVDVAWYDDEERASPAGVVPIDVQAPSFGIRFFVSEAGKFATRLSTHGDTCTVEALYPTAILRNLGGDSVSLAYWGGGNDGNGIFRGQVDGIEVSSNGLAIQDGNEVAVYLLDNPLEDYDMSSSSSSSMSSLNSSSSSSTLLNTSSSSSLSSTSVSTLSSRSSSSLSTRSSSSKSSAFSSSNSSSTLSPSSSASTSRMLLSSTSSVIAQISHSSSSSIVASILAQYRFETPPDETGIVVDDSGNGNDMLASVVSIGTIGPPEWSPAYGRGVTGGFRFYADEFNVDFLSMPRMPWLCPQGAIAFWARPMAADSGKMVVVSITNQPIELKTEIAVAITVTDGAGMVEAWASVDGQTQWAAATANGTFASDVWHQFVLVQDGSAPRMYVDGEPVAIVLTGDATGAWLDDLAVADSPADRLIVGATTRGYLPFMSLGFSGLLDEVTIWDAAISASDVDALYHSTEP